MRFLAGGVLFALILGSTIAWGEAFPGARGQREADLAATPIGRLSAPAGAVPVSSTYEPAHWALPPISISLLGGEQQLVCARITRLYHVARADAVVQAIYEEARLAGLPTDRPAAGATQTTFDQGPTRVAISWNDEHERLGYDVVQVQIIDKPEPLGGYCEGTRLGRYPTRLNY